MSKDWKGNKASVHSTLGTNWNTKTTNPDRGPDFFATNPQALIDLLEYEEFKDVWEPADGMGHLCNVLAEKGILARHSDLYDRGCGESGIDFLLETSLWNGDIVTNPPYKWADSFVKHSLEIIPAGRKVAMFLRIQYLEGKRRFKEIYSVNSPKTIYIWPGRQHCGFNGNMEITHGSPMMFAWFIWEKGFRGDPTIRWFPLDK